MKRFLTLLLLFFHLALGAQNLIPNPGADEYLECPEVMGYGLVPTPTPDYPPALDGNVLYWKTYTGSPDYLNTCSPVIGSSNPHGYQEALSGSGYFGAITYFFGLPTYREFFGVELLAPLEIGEEYHVSFHASLSFKSSGAAILASNNLGVLLMTQNYIPVSNGEYGNIDFSHYAMESILTDTNNWKKFSFQLIADSAYTQIVFGNFYDDASTDTLYPFIYDDGGAFANYYLDDFCVAKDSTFCPGVLNAGHTSGNGSFSLYPNPCIDYLKFKGTQVLSKIEIWSGSGSMLSSNNQINKAEGQISIDLNPGLYFARFYTEEGILTKRFVVQ